MNEQITNEEKGYLSIIRLNKLFPIKGINKKWNIGNLEIEFEYRSKKNLWGRFGGGWNWELGVQMGRTTWIFNLLVFSIIFRKVSKIKERV